MESTKISIIIATLNADKFLERTLLSITTQTYNNYEIIVHDGGSSDSTIPILKSFAPKVKWISEPRKGIYEAWNRALSLAQGDWVIFLGGDDCFINSDVLNQAVYILNKQPKHIDFVYGSLVNGINGAVSGGIERSLSTVYHLMLSDMGLPFPATFVRKKLFDNNKFNIDYVIAGDFDFVIRNITANNVEQMPLTITYMERGGISDSKQTVKILIKERIYVLKNHVLNKAKMLAEASIKNLLKEYALKGLFD